MFAVQQVPPRSPVKPAGGLVAFVGPQPHFRESGTARERHTGTQHPLAQPQPAGLRHQQEQTQLCCFIVKRNTKDAAQPLACPLGNPTPFPGRIMPGDKVGQDTVNKGGEGLIKPLITRIEQAVLRNQPRGVGGAKGSDQNILHSLLDSKGGLILNPLRASTNSDPRRRI